MGEYLEGVGADFLENPFNIFLLRQKEGEYGQEINSTSDLLGLRRQTSIDWLKKEEYEEGEMNVKNFINHNLNSNSNLRLFREILKDKIQEGKEYVSNYTLNDIGYYLPYIFSSRYLFEPVRTILYCLKNNISSDHVKEIEKLIEPEMISSEAMRAVYDSYKYNKTYVSEALELFSSEPMGIGKQAKNFAVQVFETTKSVVESMRDIGDYIAESPEKIKNYFRSFWAKKDATVDSQKEKEEFTKWHKEATDINETEYSNNIHDFYKLVFHDIRPYGEFLIHFGFLQSTCPRKNINGRIFYYLYEQPAILISSIESKCEIYQSNNGLISLIPESMFTIDFLRGIIRGEVALKGANLLKQLKIQNTETNEEKEAKEQFRDKYLKWNKRPIAKGKLEKAVRNEWLEQKKKKTLQIKPPENGS